MKLATRLSLAALALVVASVGAVQAAQVVRFKTGFEMVALKVRTEGEMVILTLEGGSEVGFPKWTIQDLEKGVHTGIKIHRDTYSRNKVNESSYIGTGLSPISSTTKKKIEAPEKIIARSGAEETVDSRGITVGYSLGGPQKRFSAGPDGPVHSSGKIGTSIKDFMTRKRGIDPATGKQVVRTVQPVAPAAKK